MRSKGPHAARRSGCSQLMPESLGRPKSSARSLEPVTRLTFAMRDRKHMHVLVVVREENDVRKSMDENLLIRATRTPKRRAMRTFDEGGECAIDF